MSARYKPWFAGATLWFNSTEYALVIFSLVGALLFWHCFLLTYCTGKNGDLQWPALHVLHWKLLKLMLIKGALLSDITYRICSKDSTDMHKLLFRYIFFYVGINLIVWDTKELVFSQPAVTKLCLLCSGGLLFPQLTWPASLPLLLAYATSVTTSSSNLLLVWGWCEIPLVLLWDFKSLNDSVHALFNFFFPSDVWGFHVHWNKITFNY